MSIRIQLSHFAVYQNLTQYCRPGILQLQKRKKNPKARENGEYFNLEHRPKANLLIYEKLLEIE